MLITKGKYALKLSPSNACMCGRRWLKQLISCFLLPTKLQQPANLITQVVSSPIVDGAFPSVKNKHLALHVCPNNDLWTYLTSSPVQLDKLRQQVQQSTFVLPPITQLIFIKNEFSQQANYSICEPYPEMVLRIVSTVSVKYLKLCLNLTETTHLSGYGLLKTAAKKARAFCVGGIFYLKTDIKNFYTSFDQCLLINMLAKHFKDRRVLGLINHYANRCETCNSERVLISGERTPYGCPLFPLTGAFYCNATGRPAKQKKIHYVSQMEDFVFFERSLYAFKPIIEQAYCTSGHLKLTLAINKSFILKCRKGCDFLGYRIGCSEDSSTEPAGIYFAKKCYVRWMQKVYFLYENQGDSVNLAGRLDRCLKSFVKWAKTGFKLVYLASEIHINLTNNEEKIHATNT